MYPVSLTQRPDDPLPFDATLTSGVQITPVESPAITSSRRVTLLARYPGRHQRQPRHGAWMNKERSPRKKYSRQLLPAAAALAVAGILVGGGGLVITFGGPGPSAGLGSGYGYDAADYPPAD